MRNGRLSFANLSLKATANCSQERELGRELDAAALLDAEIGQAVNV